MPLSNRAVPYLMGAFAAAAIGLVVIVETARNNMYTAAEGATYLQEKGYTAIQGGERDYFNMCGKDVFARSYTAQDADGRTVTKTVCFTPLFGPHLPLIAG